MNEPNSGGCPKGTVSLTEKEIALLEGLAEIPFRPVARRGDSDVPFCLDEAGRDISEELMWLRLKGLVTLDYDLPLVGFDYAGYEKYPIRGSFTLTAKGQEVLDSLEIMGAAE